jgi:hypothetical protein
MLPFTYATKLDKIIAILATIQAEMLIMSATVSTIDSDIAELQSDVAALTTTVGSAVALIDGFAAQLAAAQSAALAAGATPEELSVLTALHASISAQTTALAAAVAANTPAAPAPPPAAA